LTLQKTMKIKILRILLINMYLPLNESLNLHLNLSLFLNKKVLVNLDYLQPKNCSRIKTTLWLANWWADL
jgi:hypothetical protein